MDGFGHDFLPGPCLTLDEDSDIRRSHFLHGAEDIFHLRRFTEDFDLGFQSLFQPNILLNDLSVKAGIPHGNPRLTADGRLRLCLLREKEVDLLTPLRAGATLDELRQIILDGVWEKPWGHGLADGVIPLNRVMNEIGG